MTTAVSMGESLSVREFGHMRTRACVCACV